MQESRTTSSFSHIRFQHQSSSKCFLRKPFLKATPHNLISHHFQHIYRLVWEGPSCLKHTYTKKHTHIYIHMTYMIIYVYIYIYTVSISPNPLGFNFHFPVSIVAFQCHTLKLQDRIHLNIAVAGPASALALRGCGLICFHIFCTNSRQLGNLWCFHLDFQHPRVERCRKWF